METQEKYLTIYWGQQHTFDFQHEGSKIRLDISRNVPRKHEASFLIDSIEQLNELYMDQDCSLRFYISDYYLLNENDVKRFIELYNQKLTKA